jgi:hypothetical protein
MTDPDRPRSQPPASVPHDPIDPRRAHGAPKAFPAVQRSRAPPGAVGSSGAARTVSRGRAL